MMMIRAALAVALVFGLLATPLTVEAQQPARHGFRIGLLSAIGPESREVAAFEQGLRDLGYVDGQNITLERRFAHGRLGQMAALAAELVQQHVDVIVALDPPSTDAVRKVTKTIPIVMRASSNPVAGGLVASLAKPGGNITGMYSLYDPLSPKRLELLTQLIPGLRRVGVLWDPEWSRSGSDWKTVEQAARSLGIEAMSLPASGTGGFAGAFQRATDMQNQAVITLRHPRLVAQLSDVVQLASKYRVPVIYDEETFVHAGGLMSYGASLAELHRSLAGYVDKILKGVRASELPVQQPTKFELVINLKTARALGLTIPPSLLLRADQVIE